MKKLQTGVKTYEKKVNGITRVEAIEPKAKANLYDRLKPKYMDALQNKLTSYPKVYEDVVLDLVNNYYVGQLKCGTILSIVIDNKDAIDPFRMFKD